jgi:hypothetical protein
VKNQTACAHAAPETSQTQWMIDPSLRPFVLSGDFFLDHPPNRSSDRRPAPCTESPVCLHGSTAPHTRACPVRGAGVSSGVQPALAQDELQASMLRRARRSLCDGEGGVCRASGRAIEIRPGQSSRTATDGRSLPSERRNHSE